MLSCLSDTVEPGLSGLVGTRQNSPENLGPYNQKYER